MSRSRKKKKVQLEKHSSNAFVFLSRFSCSIIRSRDTHRTTRGAVDALLPARRGEESDNGRAAEEEQQRRAASDDDDVDAAVFFVFKELGMKATF